MLVFWRVWLTGVGGNLGVRPSRTFPSQARDHPEEQFFDPWQCDRARKMH